MAKIITVTLNPAIDKSTAIPSLVPEKKLRCKAPVFEPGGGGINVARAIQHLGGSATAFYPAGGYSGQFFNQLLQKEEIAIHPISVQSHTRENLIVFDQSTGQQYRFGMPGSPLEEKEWMALLEQIRAARAGYIVASGSLPPGVPTDIFARMAAIAHESGARLIVDTSGEALKEAVKAGVYLLKPNLGELSSLVGVEEVKHESVKEIARELISRGGCEVVVVSLGAGGAMLVTRNEAYQAVPPIVKRLSTVGAGDSMVAGLVLKLSQGAGLQDALCYGVASGTAATMNPGTQLCRKADVERLAGIVSSGRA